MKRQKRAGWALTALAISGFMFADIIGYGADKGYNTAFALSVGVAFAIVSVALFAWNVGTYRK